jgi:hypothetical protein
METREYYHQTPIMKRILEYCENSVSVSGGDPSPSTDRHHRRYPDVISAMGRGCDLYRSILDFKGPLFVLDLEYANKEFPGEIFHNPIKTFEKLEPIRTSIRDILNEYKVDHFELMTGRGYNFVMQTERGSPSYDALTNIGNKLKVLPKSAEDKLLKKEEQYGNIPLINDNLAFATFGRITDYIFSKISNNSQLAIKTTDLFDEKEIGIFDTTLFGYLINRRSTRCAFSLHQKHKMNTLFNYQGPPIVAIPIQGIPLKERVKIRQDERDNYNKAVALANEVSTRIPQANLSSLITDYLLSETFQEHIQFSKDLENGKLQHFDPHDLEKNGRTKNLEQQSKSLLHNPNPSLLDPWHIRHLIRDLKENKFTFPEIFSILEAEYIGNYSWNNDLEKSDPALRAEYWTRTLWNA